MQQLLPIKVWDFVGGVHPPMQKSQSNTQIIRKGPMPEFLTVPLSQHRGNAAIAQVKVNDSVLKGQLIGKAGPGLSGEVHAPSSGVVVDVGLYPVQHPSQLTELCVRIKTDGTDTWIQRSTRSLQQVLEMPTADIIEQVHAAGIVGMGGAAFPTHIKLGTKAQIHQLIVNGVECEPYISCDDRLMQERAVEIIQGAHIIAKALGAAQVLLGIEDNKPEAIVQLKKALAAESSTLPFEIRVVPTKYPSGGEKQLVQLLTGKEIPKGGIPADLGLACQNVATCYAVKRALVDGEPLIQRLTTLTGSGFANKGNYELLIGTSVADLFAFADAKVESISRLIMGGPMMGFTLGDPNVPIVKSTNCIIAGTNEDFPPPLPEQPCIRCGHCVEVCPAQLLPQQLYYYARAQDYQRSLDYELMDCIECGACAYVCPSQIPLVQYYRSAKSAIAKQNRETKTSDLARSRFEARKARLAHEQAEKEKKRQARLARSKAAVEKTSSTDASPQGLTTEEIDPLAKQKQLQTKVATQKRMYQEVCQALAYAKKQGENEAKLASLNVKVEKLRLKLEELEEEFKKLEAEKA